MSAATCPTEQVQHRLQMIMQMACEHFKRVHCIGSANRRGRGGWRGGGGGGGGILTNIAKLLHCLLVILQSKTASGIAAPANHALAPFLTQPRIGAGAELLPVHRCSSSVAGSSNAMTSSGARTSETQRAAGHRTTRSLVGRAAPHRQPTRVFGQIYSAGRACPSDFRLTRKSDFNFVDMPSSFCRLSMHALVAADCSALRMRDGITAPHWLAIELAEMVLSVVRTERWRVFWKKRRAKMSKGI